jgi:hypothetical protein
MDYATFAIICWIITTIIVAIVGKKAFFKIFGMPHNKVLKVELRGYLFCSAIVGAAISIGITYFIIFLGTL